jgi:hypothetical protein
VPQHLAARPDLLCDLARLPPDQEQCGKKATPRRSQERRLWRLTFGDEGQRLHLLIALVPVDVQGLA